MYIDDGKWISCNLPMTQIKSFFAILILSLNFTPVFAADKLPFDYDPAIAKEMAKRQHSEIDILRSPAPYMWLYKILIPAELQNKTEAMKSFKVHLQDSYSAFPNPDAIVNAALKNTGVYRGSITYVGFWPMNYRYDVLQGENNRRIIRVKVHFKNASAQDLQQFQVKIKDAEAFWNASRPKLDFVYKFYFEVVTDPAQAHYSVNVLDSTRGPYSINWGRDWSSHTIAHELGHMMGLGDEYETLTGKVDCLRGSLMCESSSGALMPHHYYFILRRFI